MECKRCKNCEWWKDYTDRVFARLSVPVETDNGYGRVELRRCKYLPPPNVNPEGPVYTNEHFVCSEWRKRNEKSTH